MRYSKLFGKTQRIATKGSELLSHNLLVRGGFIRESTAGRYFFLPLGWRVHEKIKRVIKDEMDAAGAMEMITPVLHPLELWQETNRTNTAGFELMKVTDRRKAEFALGGTAEEMFVDVVRKFNLSYRDLPFNIYQFSTKFRDELRARGGLLRVREFVMKDAYSFHASEEDFKREYDSMAEVYTRIFKRLGLETVKVEAGNGYIGGEYSHEFQFLCENGEDLVFISGEGTDKQQAYNAEKAPCQAPVNQNQEPEAELKEVEGVGIIGVEELAEFLKIPVEKTTKTIIYQGDESRILAAAVRGGYEINEDKLKSVSGCHQLKLASAEVVREVTGAEVGYAGLLNLPQGVEVFIDESCNHRTNFEMGANKTNYHTLNVNWGRDLPVPAQWVEIKQAKEGDVDPDTGEVYRVYRGIEVGNIFQLGYHYSTLMKGAEFTDQEGKLQKYYMGCYGIGLGRTLATLVEKYHDDRGIVWPDVVAPFKLHLVHLGGDSEVINRALDLYQILKAQGIEVLWDDRNESPGVKFSDADLIGIPIRLVISARNGGKVEWKRRNENETELLEVEEVVNRLTGK